MPGAEDGSAWIARVAATMSIPAPSFTCAFSARRRLAQYSSTPDRTSRMGLSLTAE